jgi:plasmid stabilization system protein ParE
MGVIRRTPTSRRDYREIWEYVAARNLDAADSLVRMFEAALELLSNHPQAGPQRPDWELGFGVTPWGTISSSTGPLAAASTSCG